MVGFETWGSRDFHQTLLEVGVILVASWIKLFDIELLQKIFDDLVAFLYHSKVFVFRGTLDLSSELAAVSDTISHFEQLFSDLGNSKLLAFFDFPE